MANASPDTIAESTTSGAVKDLRVAWLFPSLARGFYWQPVFREFVSRCPHTAVFTCSWPGFAPGFENSFEVHTLPGLGYVDIKKKLPDARRGFIWTPPSILRKLAAFKPDVVFSSGFSGWTVCALLFKFLGRTRVIIYWEGCSVQSVGPSKVKAMLRRWMARFADAAVSNAEEGAAYLREVIGMPQDKLLCHPCQVPDLPLLCLDAAKASLPGSLLAPKRPVFLYVGSLSPRKGWRCLIDATRVLVSQGIQQFSVWFAGAGEQEEEMRVAIRDYKLDGIVHQVGGVPYHNLGSYYRSADVFVSPTRADTWGVAVLEAMAFGKSVLCSKYAGSRQMVVHGENGFIFDPFDADQLAGYMARFIHDRTLVERMGALSLEKMTPFTPACAAEALANLAVQGTQRQNHPSRSVVSCRSEEIKMKVRDGCKSLLLRTHRVWSRAMPDSYRLYKCEGGFIYLNVKESHKMLERALGCYERAKHQALQSFMRPGMTFVDVGCNKGDFCLAASRLVGSGGRVLAFEPHPENYRWIRKSILKNEYRNIDLYELALSDSNGTAHLHLGEQSGHHTLLAGRLRHERGLIEVQTRMLDDLLEETRFPGPIDAIKIDVEGADLQVLRGARRTLLSNPGMVVFLDLHPQLGVNTAEVCAFLRDLGFALKKEEPPFNVPIESYASLNSLVAVREGQHFQNPS